MNHYNFTVLHFCILLLASVFCVQMKPPLHIANWLPHALFRIAEDFCPTFRPLTAHTRRIIVLLPIAGRGKAGERISPIRWGTRESLVQPGKPNDC
jgi:hypothetical protein